MATTKFEISGNYFKITTGSENPIRQPFRDTRFNANETEESIRLYFSQGIGKIGEDEYLFEDVAAEGSVTIDTVSPTKATGTVTLASALVNVFATNTAQLISVLAGETLIVNNLTYTAVAGSKGGDNTKFSIDTSDTAAALDLADSITNDTRSGTSGDQTATSSTDTVTITTDVLGVAGNAITLAETGGNFTLGGATFSGGVDADTVLFDGKLYTAVDQTKINDTEFDVSGSNNAAATDLADSIDDDVRTGTSGLAVTATATTSVVTIVETLGGTTGNALLLSSSDGTRLAVSGANLTGGLDDAEVTGILINSVEVMNGAETSGADKDVLATQVAASITAKTSDPNYTAEAAGAVVTITADTESTAVNGFVVASTVVKATSTDANMAGAGASILTGAGVPFVDWDTLLAFLEDNTGGELIP